MAKTPLRLRESMGETTNGSRPDSAVKPPVFPENQETSTHHGSNRRHVSCHPLARDMYTIVRPECRSQLPNFRSTCCDPGTARSKMRPVEIAQSNQPRTSDDDRQGRDLVPEAVIERPEENPLHSFSVPLPRKRRRPLGRLRMWPAADSRSSPLEPRDPAAREAIARDIRW